MARYGSRFHRSGVGRLPAIARLLPGLESVHDERITLLAVLLGTESLLGEQLNTSNDGNAQLTPRELQVLTAMADGATNKAIARRLGISFHTVKFHVAAILEKLDADTRTEAVMKAAQLGIVML